MAIKQADQITILDITDAYSVILSNDTHSFIGGTDAALAGSATTQVYAFCGAEQVPVTIGTITTPTGVTAKSDGDADAPTITISVTTSVTTGGVVKIPVTITGKGVTITKEFTYSIAFKGVKGADGEDADPLTITSQSVTYQAGSSGTTTPTSSWSTTVPTVSAGQYLWTKTYVKYSDGTETTSYAVSYKAVDGEDADPLTITNKTVTYQVGSSGTTTPTGSWSTTVPSAAQGKFLWTRTYVKYSDGTETTSYAVSYIAIDGTNGEDAITISITTDNGNIFKNSEGTTTLTAHVYVAGAELSATEIATLGTLKWYKDGSTTVAGTGATLAVAASSISNKAVYTVQLEG